MPIPRHEPRDGSCLSRGPCLGPRHTVCHGFPLGFDRSLHHDQFFEGMLHVLSAHVDELVGKLVRGDPTITTIIADTFFVWPSTIAQKYNLVNVSFFSEPALILTLYYHVKLLKKNGHFGSSTDYRSDAIDYIPGIKSIMPEDFISYLQAKDDIHTVIHRLIYKAFGDAKEADFMLCNTVLELEEEAISALQQIQPFYSVGPVFTPRTGSRQASGPSRTAPSGSVLYILLY